jgi:hypothetical protein
MIDNRELVKDPPPPTHPWTPAGALADLLLASALAHKQHHESLYTPPIAKSYPPKPPYTTHRYNAKGGSMSRSTSQASTATTTTSHGISRSLSVKTSNKPQPLNPTPTPDVKLFVTNLRLLDLDLRNDWPGITVQTFSAKNADQRQRISGTEWALFRLFEIWDPNETAQVYWVDPLFQCMC